MLHLDVESFCDKVGTCQRRWADNDGGLWCWGDCPTDEQKQAISEETSEEYIEEVPAMPSKKKVKVSEHDVCWMALYIAIMCDVSQEQAFLRIKRSGA